jgi:hypothetical protein
VEVGIGQSFKEHAANVLTLPFTVTRYVDGQRMQFVIVNHLSILSVVRPQLYQSASNLQQKKKNSGPTHPRHHQIKGKNPRKKKTGTRKKSKAPRA